MCVVHSLNDDICMRGYVRDTRRNDVISSCGVCCNLRQPWRRGWIGAAFPCGFITKLCNLLHRWILHAWIIYTSSSITSTEYIAARKFWFRDMRQRLLSYCECIYCIYQHNYISITALVSCLHFVIMDAFSTSRQGIFNVQLCTVCAVGGINCAVVKQTKKPYYRKETARCRSCSFRFKVLRQHSLKFKSSQA